jgi:hypothetical protein
MTRVSTLLTTLIFATLGPGIGALFWVVLMYSQDSLAHSRPVLPSASDAGLLAAVVGVAYFLCWLPAALTGLAWGELARYLRARRPLTRFPRALIGAGIGAVAGALWEVTGRTADPLIYAKCGAVAGAFLAAFFPLDRWLMPPSNNRLERSQVEAASIRTAKD